MTTTLEFALPDGSTRTVKVTRLLNAGYTGRAQDEVAAHVAELAELGVPAPSVIPALYPVAPYLAAQVDVVPAQHARTSGEAEWALVVGDDPADPLLTVACDHTDRALEVHGVAWSKNASLDVLGAGAWRLAEIADHLDAIRLKAWVRHGSNGAEQLVQDAALAALLPPAYWLDVLSERGWLVPGTVLLSGTVAMIPGVDQFADGWRVELHDPVTERSLSLGYAVDRLPEPIG
jgi:2-keto-4-pentenoate hydratase/2-oxohepta-3-ene-1,7-dioic acid hydratase in catechol pathway